MAYGVKYIMQFTSDRGNEIRIEVLKKDYQGEVIYKSLGGSPSLSIEQGDAAVKGSSLVFAMQADIEGELQELYTTDNKLFKVNMYRNEVLSWQGYILPELYSEEYVDAPYDVSVTATDQLATLKAITYQREDVNVSISTMIEDILSFTQVSLPVTYHQNLSAIRKGEVPMLVDSHISQAAYNGYSCYDVLTNILLSCNCCIMQINGEWLITSLTNSTTNYYSAGVNVVREHKILGQLGVGEVCPAGTLTMVNNPALKGAKVEYAHMLRNSFLVNADCMDREGWNYTPDSRNPIDIPGEREAFGKIFKAYCWELHPVNIREDNSLQLWQEVALEKDERNYYDLSVKTLFGTNAKLLLMAVTYLGSDGIERRLTAEGWVEQWDKSDVNYYIQITGTNKNAGLDAIADIEQYEMSTVQFALPPVDGTMRVGFINSTTDYAEPLASAPIYVSQVYLTVSGVTGQECTTEVEPNATQEQQGVLLVYGDTFESENAYKLGLNTLKKSSGENITSWWLDNVNFSSYYDTMLQEFSRYFGVKKAQLQGIIMGKDVLSDMYADVFSGRVMRLLTAQVDLLADEASVTVEEVITTTVDFDTVIYAANNTNSFGSSSGGGAGTSGGASSTAGESLLGVQSDGDVYVKDGRALVGQEGRFENLALPVVAPLERAERKTYVYASNPDRGVIDLEKIAKYIEDQEALWVLDKENGVIRTTYNVVSEQEIISNRRASGSGSGGGGGISEITAQMVVDALGYVPYSSLNPAGYITSAALDGYAKTSDIPSLSGYATENWVSNNYQPKGNYLTSVSWDIVGGKPTTLGGYGITDAIELYVAPNYIGARFKSGENATGDKYLEWWNSAGWVHHKAGKYSVADGTSSQFLKADGSLDNTAYLPLSGGKIDSTSEEPITINSNQSQVRLLVQRYNTSKSTLGWHSNFGTWMYDHTTGKSLGIRDNDGTPFYYDTTFRTLIHSGNIGSQSVNYASSAGNADTLDGLHSDDLFVRDLGIVTSSLNANDCYKTGIYLNTGAGSIENNWPVAYGSMVNFSPKNTQNYTASLFFSAFGDILARIKYDTQPYRWKTIAFTDSNVASATKLQTARNIWGQSFDGSGDVSGKLSNATAISFDTDCGVYQGSTFSGSMSKYDIAYYGTNHYFHNFSSGYNLIIKENGNVLIGTISDNGAKLQIHTTSGAQSVRINSTVNEYGYDYNAVGIYHNDNIKLSFGWNSEPKSASNAGAYFKNYVSGATISLFNEGGIYFSDNVLIGISTDNGAKLQVKGNIDTFNDGDYSGVIGFNRKSAIGGLYNTAHHGWQIHNYRGVLNFYVERTDGSGTSVIEITDVGDFMVRGEVISSRRATSSDARLKDNINRLIAEDCLAIVRNLQPSSWDWKENGEHSMGFIAQDIEPLMPYAVTRIKDDELGMRLNLQYDQFIALAIGGVQAVDNEVQQLKKEVAELKNRLSKYETVWQ